MRLTEFKFLMTRRAILPVAILSMLAAGLFVFQQLAEEILEGEALALDSHLLLALRDPADLAQPIGPRWLEQTAVELTTLGGYPFIVLLTLIVAGYLGVTAKPWAAVYVVASISGGASVSSILKEVFDRPRPDLVEHLVPIQTASFPSGHAMVGTVTYLTLGALLLRYARTRAEKVYIVFVAGFLALALGVSRVYLGVHWPSDVVAGWALGVSWAALVWCVVTLIEYRDRLAEAAWKAERASEEQRAGRS